MILKLYILAPNCFINLFRKKYFLIFNEKNAISYQNCISLNYFTHHLRLILSISQANNVNKIQVFASSSASPCCLKEALAQYQVIISSGMLKSTQIPSTVSCNTNRKKSRSFVRKILLLK